MSALALVAGGETPRLAGWDAAVAEGRALLGKIKDTEQADGQWRLALGQLVGRTCPKQEHGGGQKGNSNASKTTGQRGQSFQQGLLEQFAKDIGSAARTLRRYRDVAAHWEGKDTTGKTWNQLLRAAGIKQSGSSHPKKTPAPKLAPKPVPKPDDALAEIRARNEAAQYRSMVNAPPRSLNLPLLRRMEQVISVLGELMALDPEIAVTQLPPERYGDFAFTEFAEWLLRFTALCEKRRQEETPDVDRTPYRPPRDAINPVIFGQETLPVEDERLLSPAERRVFAWLRKQKDPVKAESIALGLKTTKAAVQQRMTRLLASGLVEKGGHVKAPTYHIREDAKE